MFNHVERTRVAEKHFALPAKPLKSYFWPSFFISLCGGKLNHDALSGLGIVVFLHACLHLSVALPSE